MATAQKQTRTPRFQLNGSDTSKETTGRCAAKVETWTPSKARKQLESNVGNRPRMENTVLDLAQAIENGEWDLNGETIKVDVNGNLIDGQHRLEAVVLADKPIESLTVRGLPPHSFDTVDRGKVRTVSHIMACHGEVSTNKLAAAISWLWKYQNAAIRKSGPGSAPRAPQAMALLEANPKIRESVRMTRQVSTFMSASIAAAMHYLFSKVSKERADHFFAQLASGEQLKKSQGVYQLRERMLSNRGAKTKLKAVDVCALVIKAWNAESSGQAVRTLAWRSEGPTAEAFPKIEGLKG